MEIPEWTESYNCHGLRLGSIKVNVNLNGTAPKGSPSGYEVSVSTYVGSRRLKRLFTNLDDGKAAGIRLAQKILAETQKNLSLILTETPQQSPEETIDRQRLLIETLSAQIDRLAEENQQLRDRLGIGEEEV